MSYIIHVFSLETRIWMYVFRPEKRTDGCMYEGYMKSDRDRDRGIGNFLIFQASSNINYQLSTMCNAQYSQTSHYNRVRIHDEFPRNPVQATKTVLKHS